MRKIKIPKRSGGYRLIYMPNWAEKARLRFMVPELNKLVMENCDLTVAHGFVPTRSPVTNAEKHIGYNYTLSADLQDFFESVTLEHVKDWEYIKDNSFLLFTKKFCNLGQGYPTSPAIANLACISLDKELTQISKENNCVYTRYADDLSFSCNSLETLKSIRNMLPGIVQIYKFKINPKKTKIQCANFGRRNITGVYVDNKRLYTSREFRRRLRAAIKRNNKKQVRGMKEWLKLNKPHPQKSPRISKVSKTITRHIVRILKGLKDVWK